MTSAAELLALTEELCPSVNGRCAQRLTSLLQRSHRRHIRDIEFESDDDREWILAGLASSSHRVSHWQSELAILNASGIQLIRSDELEYPSILRMIHNAPPFLFIRGQLLDADNRAIAIVGTRAAGSYGERQCLVHPRLLRRTPLLSSACSNMRRRRRLRQLAATLTILLCLTACTDQSPNDTPAEVPGVETSTTAPASSTRPVRFEEYEAINRDQTLGLFIDACNAEVDNVDVDETTDVITVAVTEIFVSPTTNELGESDEAPDCQDILNVDLEAPLDDRNVVDATTGQIANRIR